MERKWTKWYAMTSHVIAYRWLELLFGTHTFHFNCFFEDFNCVFMQIRCLSRVLWPEVACWLGFCFETSLWKLQSIICSAVYWQVLIVPPKVGVVYCFWLVCVSSWDLTYLLAREFIIIQMIIRYSKTCLMWSLKYRQNKDLNDKW